MYHDVPCHSFSEIRIRMVDILRTLGAGPTELSACRGESGGEEGTLTGNRNQPERLRGKRPGQEA